MSRMKALVLGVALVSVGSPAIACFDDEQSRSYEQNGQPGSYPQQEEQPGSYEPQEQMDLRDLAGMVTPAGSGPTRLVPLDFLMGLGTVLTAGSLGLLARQARPRG